MVDKELIESEGSEEEDVEEWQDLKEHPDYEICVNYPHQIKKKCNVRIIKESVKDNGYLYVNINGKKYYKHRLIAIQFIPNPDNHPQVDHINHNRTDNRIENLRWVSCLQNMNNQSVSNNGRKIEYVQELPDEVIVVNQYHQYHFEGYYFCNDIYI